MRNSSQCGVMSEEFDVVVVGGGPAGLSAALSLVRARRKVLVLDAGRPRNRFAAHMHGVLGHDGLSPRTLLAAGRDEILGYGGEVRDAAVTGVTVMPGIRVSSSAGEVSARRLLVATGLTDELLPIPGLRENWGTAVVVCPYCDAWERRDRIIGVVATSVDSVEQAQTLRQWTDRVVYFANGFEVPNAETSRRLRVRGIRIVHAPVVRLTMRSDQEVRLHLADGADVGVGAVFTGTTMRPNDDLLRALGARTTIDRTSEWIAVDSDGRTSVRGVWAVGNVVDPRSNVSVSLGAGSLIAGAMNADMVAEDIDAAAAEARE